MVLQIKLLLPTDNCTTGNEIKFTALEKLLIVHYRSQYTLANTGKS